MRLYKRKRTGFWYVEFVRDHPRSLKTRDKREAEIIYRKMLRAHLRGRLVQLDPGKRITLNQYAAEYLAARTDLAPDTLDMYELALRQLADSIGGNTALRNITRAKIERFKSNCRARGNRKVTVNTYLRHIKAALRYAQNEFRYTNRVPRIKMYKLGEPLPRVLNPNDIEMLLCEAKACRPELWRIMVFCLWTGARRREALSLEWSRVWLDDDARAILHGKGNKERVVPLMPPVIESLKPYEQDLGRVFRKRGPDTITHWFKVVARWCGIEARFHDLRHTAATYMLANGIDIRYVQKILGHAQLSTTQIYTHVLTDQLRKEMQKLRFD